ncbi:TlpA family protein disulfide reductase [Noviherbaspirillum galbum]|nr:TlpA disulfide reductase family protein [Noviherbaspirillum galbum]
MAAPFDVPGSGGQVRLADFRGKLVYLDFWASWCGPCRRSFPWMSQMQARYGARGLRILALNVDARRDAALAFMSDVPAQFTIGFDPAGKVAAAYGIKGMPTSVLISPDGKVMAMHAGFSDADKTEMEELFRRHLPDTDGSK